MRKYVIGTFISLVIITSFIIFKFIGLRNDFNKYLKQTYPQNTFDVSLPKVNLGGEIYYSNVFCIDDSTSFEVYKSFGTKDVEDNLSAIYNKPYDNKVIQDIFKGTEVEKLISIDSSGIRFLNENNPFHHMILIITADGNEAQTTQKIFKVLKEKKIEVKDILINYSIDQQPNMKIVGR